MTAYEVSISKLAAFDDDAEFDLDEEFGLHIDAEQLHAQER